MKKTLAALAAVGIALTLLFSSSAGQVLEVGPILQMLPHIHA